VVGEITRLYVKADGSSYVDVPTAEIDHFEAAPEEPAADRLPAPSVWRADSGFLMAVSRFAGSSQPAPTASNLDEMISMASGRYRLDPDLVTSVIKAESGFNVRAVSPKGARGLMQLMPGTASQLGVPNAFDAQANVEGGTKYLRELLERYNFDLVKALAAYNAGPERVEQFGGVPPFYETRAYVTRVVKDFNKKKAAQEKGAASQKTAPPRRRALIRSAEAHAKTGSSTRSRRCAAANGSE
jgi:soluble lytic murein transglycosylase-like protein